MRTARSLPYGGFLSGEGLSLIDTPLARDPGQRPPWTDTSYTETPWTETPWTETPLNRDSLVNRMTDRSKNITLPPTLFAGGNNRLDNYLGEGAPPVLESWIRHWYR